MKFSVNLKSLTLCVGLLGCLALFSGCFETSWKAATCPTTGSVMVNGKPAFDAFIRMTSRSGPIDERNSDCWAYVQEDGTFAMSTYEMGDGCPPGEYDLLLRWPADRLTMMPDRLGGKYWNPEDPFMTVTIEPGTNEIPPIELTGITVKPKPPGW